MIELVQLPYSPYCIVIRRILEYSKAPFKTTNVPNGDRSLVWKMTRERYYQVPILKDGRNVLFETGDNTQVLAKYVDEKFKLGLFPREAEGVQSILWRYFENEVEANTFKLNDIYWEIFIPKSDRLRFVRHKERRFGRGCLEQWKEQEEQLRAELEQKLLPCEQMLADHPFLLGDEPLFVDFDLFGMLGNLLYTKRHALPAAYTALEQWHRRMTLLKFPKSAREKLHS